MRRGWRVAGSALSAAAMLTALTRPVDGQALSVADTFKRVSPALVGIRTFDATGKAITAGSGFVASDGRIVTSAHILFGAARADVVSHDGSILGVARSAEALNITQDIAVLPKPERTPAGVLDIATTELPIGERIVAFGAPEGLSNTVSDGILSAIRQVGDRILLQITAPVSPGSSGGPITDLEGRVVGMTTGYVAAGQNLNFAVRGQDIRALLAVPARRCAFPARDNQKATAGVDMAPSSAGAPRVVDAEFASESIDLEKARAGRYRGRFKAGEPWISFYARMANLAAGDAVSLSLTGPDGSVLTSGDLTIQPDTARDTIVRFGKRRTEHETWLPGRYTARVRATRDGVEVLLVSKVVDVPVIKPK